MSQLLQLSASLVAILALAWLAARLRLGGDRVIEDETDARRLADEAVSGFVPVGIAIDRARRSALMYDSAGRILLLRRHGSHFAGRMLERDTRVACSGDGVTLTLADRRFGPASLSFEHGLPAWIARLASERS